MSGSGLGGLGGLEPIVGTPSASGHAALAALVVAGRAIEAEPTWVWRNASPHPRLMITSAINVSDVAAVLSPA